jgi:uncharacterized delta-60 repeat protein
LFLCPLPAAFGQWGLVDTTFKPGGGNNSGFDNEILAVALQSDGKIIVGGAFTQDGRSSRNGIARLNTDGMLDTGFDPGTGADNLVEALAVQTDGKVVLGGRFTTFNGAGHVAVARLNTNGSLDGSFNPAFDPAAENIIAAATLQPDGKILIGGVFTALGSSPGYIVRLNPNGSVDPGFVPAAIADNIAFHPTVLSIVLQADGRIVIGGQFTDVGGLSRNGIARLDADGKIDGTFDPGAGTGPGNYRGLYRAVNSLALRPDGKIIAGGSFTNIASITQYYVGQFNTNGSLDTNFAPSLALASGGLLAVQVELDGKVLIGGDIVRFDGLNPTNIARLNPNGSLDSTFNPGAGPSGAYPSVRAMAIQSDGKVVVGGGFTAFNGVKSSYIARLLGDQGATVQFVLASYSVDENGGSVIIDVQRTGSTNGSVSVNYLTGGGTATATADYVAQAGALVFGPGETKKQFSVPILADALVEGPETVTLTLGNPIGGAILGSQKTATLTIIDNANSPAPMFTSIVCPSPNYVVLNLSSQAGRSYVLQVANNPPNWVSIQTNTALSNTIQFVDGGATGPAVRFYRAFYH